MILTDILAIKIRDWDPLYGLMRLKVCGSGSLLAQWTITQARIVKDRTRKRELVGRFVIL